ncbi:aldehyde dehydrogenase family protein [Microvirga tunisiensis]|nr:aldehyde dehydrogenase family protein [Microvirga tunisiensis]
MNERPSSAMFSHKYFGKELGHLIGGKSVPPHSDQMMPSFNPATGEVLAYIPEGTAEDVNLAVAAARKAFEGPWSEWLPWERHRLFMRIYEVIEQNFDELAYLTTLDIGTPITKTLGMKQYALKAITYFATQTTNIGGQTLPNNIGTGVMTMTVKAPVGVIGGILPWNVPLVGLWWLLGGTLATGCTIVLKPAEYATMTILRLVELLYEAGLPEGVVNVVAGRGGVVGQALAEHNDVDRVVFTGSVQAGRKVIMASASNVKRVQVELGGKSPDIVFADAPMELAVPGAAMAVYNNCGQVCTAGTRLFVERKAHNEFVDKLVKFSRQMRIGPGIAHDTDMGPLISQGQLDRVMSYVDGAAPEGATLVTGGKRLGGDLSQGYFVEPTIFCDVRPEMTIAREEIFGPVISVIPFDTEEEALRLANETEYGLGGAVWTQDLSKAMRMINRVKAGTFWVNCYDWMDAGVGMNGYKLSGYGGKGGPTHMDNFLYQKSVYINHTYSGDVPPVGAGLRA